MEQRTTRQNKSLHLYFRLLSDELNTKGLDMVKVLKPGVEISWTEENVKNNLWRPVQEALLHKKSTKELTTSEIDKVFDIVNRHLAQFGVETQFPSENELFFRDVIK